MLVLTVTTCASSTPATLLAASSLTDVAEELALAWDPEARVSEAGSQVIAAQLAAGAPADVVLLADPALAAKLARTEDTTDPVRVASTGLAVLHRADIAIGDIDDLARPGLRLVLADEAVPLGRYTRDGLALLEQSGEGRADDVLDNARSLEDSARSVVAKLTSGEADAAVVYAADAARISDAEPDLRVLAWPDAGAVTVTYTAQALTTRGEDLVAFLQSDAAASIWRDHGFSPL